MEPLSFDMEPLDLANSQPQSTEMAETEMVDPEMTEMPETKIDLPVTEVDPPEIEMPEMEMPERKMAEIESEMPETETPKTEMDPLDLLDPDLPETEVPVPPKTEMLELEPEVENETASLEVIKPLHDEETLKFVYTFEGHVKLIQNHLQCQWTEGAFCDLELHTFNGCIPVHAWLFACFSPKIATVLKDSTRDNTVFSLEILFAYDVVKAIVEAIYSGIFSATLENLDELQEALRWLEMHELLAVIKAIQEEAIRENLITVEKKEPIEDPTSSERRKSLRIKKSKFGSKRMVFKGDPQNCYLVSWGKDMSIIPSPDSSPEPKAHKSKKRRRVKKKSTKQAKAKPKKSEAKPQPKKKVKPKPKETEKKPRSRKSGKSKKKSRTLGTESEEEKKKDATEALMSMRRNVWKDEFPELVAVNGDEVEQAILSNNIKCDKCFKTFTSLDEYNSHVENHPTYTCEKCSMVYYSRPSLIRHVRGAHLKSVHLKCSECDFTAKECKELEQHCATVHEEFRPFKCMFEGCTFKTSKYRYLSRHFENHEDKKLRSCACEKCHRVFKRYDLLYSHRRSCYHVQKYLCDLCGQSFNHLPSMKTHRRTMHFGEKPYCCKVCPKTFSNGANLRRHMRIHNNSYPYSCSVCKKQFRHSNTLKLHMSKHNKEAVEPTSAPPRSEHSGECMSTPPSIYRPPSSSLFTSNSFFYSIPSFTASLPSVLSSIQANEGIPPQGPPIPPFMPGSSMHGDKPFGRGVSASDNAAAASFLQYSNQLSWPEAGNYRLSNL